MLKANKKTTFELGLEMVCKKLNYLGLKNIEVEKVGNKKKIRVNENKKSYELLTRTRTNGTWQTSTRYGIKSSIKKKEHVFWIFVDLINGKNKPEFFIVPRWWISNNIYETHLAYLTTHGGHRAKTENSTHHAINLRRIECWHNRWDLIGIKVI